MTTQLMVKRKRGEKKEGGNIGKKMLGHEGMKDGVKRQGLITKGIRK